MWPLSSVVATGQRVARGRVRNGPSWDDQLPVTPEERHKLAAQLGPFKTSMLQDWEAENPLEVEALVEHQKDWFDDTMQYLAERYPALDRKATELAASARSLHPREFGLHHQVEPVTDQTGAHGGQQVYRLQTTPQGVYVAPSGAQVIEVHPSAPGGDPDCSPSRVRSMLRARHVATTSSRCRFRRAKRSRALRWHRWK